MSQDPPKPPPPQLPHTPWRKVVRVIAQEGRMLTLLLECGHTRQEKWKGRMMRICQWCMAGKNPVDLPPPEIIKPEDRPVRVKIK